MKKLLALVSLMTLFGLTFAVDINLSSSMRLSENEGIVQMSTVSINFSGTHITTFDLVLGAADYVIFHTPGDIKINGSGVKSSVSLDHKRLIFVGDFSGALTIEGIQIRTYDQSMNGVRLGLNRTGDMSPDTYSINVIEQDQDGKNSDTMKPLPVSDLKYTLSGTAIIVTRNPSPDLDLLNTTVEIYKNNGYLRYFTVGAKDTSTTISDLDTTKDTIKIVVSAKDVYYMSDPTTIEIPKSQAVVETGVSTGTTTGTDITTGTVIDTGTTITSGDITNSPFSTELNTAYQYAYSIGITTMPSIQQANINGSLIRAHMAKMMVNYAKEVLGKTPNINIICAFTDTEDQTTEMKGYIEEACQMGLMGVNTTEFNPNGTVTRAQFGTVLSRVLYGTSNEGGTPYYINHLQALEDNGIITNTDPDLQEIRGYVMLMMQRASQ